MLSILKEDFCASVKAVIQLMTLGDGLLFPWVNEKGGGIREERNLHAVMHYFGSERI